MIYSEVIIIGGGPAGSSCAYKLKKAGVDCLILDKESFPRKKLCAGWITPGVLKKLDLDLKDYPKGFLCFKTMHVHVYGLTKKIKTEQYSIRRYEFDEFLFKRAESKYFRHTVKDIKKVGEHFVIDDKFECKYLVGAAGSFCPVYLTFFRKNNPRKPKKLVVAMEEEFKYDYKDDNCHLWFFKKGLPGYSWYVPKANGYINIGIGGIFKPAGKSKKDILYHWKIFTAELEKKGLIKKHDYKPEGYIYHLREKEAKYQIGNAYIIGDSAGVATTDLGEGIEPSIETGILCAEAIMKNKKLNLDKVKKRSFTNIEYLKFIIK